MALTASVMDVAPPTRTTAWDVALDVASLTKPAITLQVVVTHIGGMWLAPGAIPWDTAIGSTIGTTAIVGAACALNCYLERETDGLMRRTASRPLPSGRLQPWVALATAAALGALAVPLLAAFGGPLVLGLGVAALVTYVAVYTPLKRRTWLSLPVGAIPGAIPPLMGWAAIAGELGAGAWVAFAMLFFWQFPHFLAIGLRRRREYRRAGLVTMTSAFGERATARATIVSAALLVLVSLALPLIGLAGWLYTSVAVLAGAWLVWTTLPGWRANVSVSRWAKKVFVASLVHLMALFIALPLDFLVR